MITKQNSKDSLYLISSKLHHIFQLVMGFLLFFSSCGKEHCTESDTVCVLLKWKAHRIRVFPLLFTHWRDGVSVCTVGMMEALMWCVVEMLHFMLPHSTILHLLYFILLSYSFICFLSFGSNGFNSSTHPVENPICLCASECMHSICSSGCICSVCTCTRSTSI